MLTWFPEPYPEEWWYSVLCRYYVRTGIKEHNKVKKMLFDGQAGAHMGVLFPNATIRQVTKQLPPDLFDTRRIILDHTPFLFFTRLYSREEREDMLRRLCEGEVFQLSHLWKAQSRSAWAPRYCPLCVKEDTEFYGEPYWHVDHQIPAMRVCTRHHCRLKQADISPPWPALNAGFYPASTMARDETPDRDFSLWEETMSRHARAFWKVPFSIGPVKGHNNLVQALKNRGYFMIGKSRRGVFLNTDLLYTDMIAAFGRETVELAFGENFTTDMARRIERWEQLLPDRYILLQMLIGLPVETVFDEEPMEDKLKIRLEAAAVEGGFRTHAEAAKELGLKRYELNTLVQLYEMEPFWMTPLKKKASTSRNAAIRFVIDERELAEIEAYSKARGYRCVGHFAMQCIRYVMRQDGHQGQAAVPHGATEDPQGNSSAPLDSSGIPIFDTEISP